VKVICPSDPSGYLCTTIGKSMKEQRQRRTASTLDRVQRAASRPGHLVPYVLDIKYESQSRYMLHVKQSCLCLCRDSKPHFSFFHFTLTCFLVICPSESLSQNFSFRYIADRNCFTKEGMHFLIDET